MKKTFAFLRSMKFGMILLTLILLASFAGSMIPQERAPMEYVSRYGEAAANWIAKTGLDNVFSSPVFLLLLAALSVNLILCSLVRLPKARRAGAALLRSAEIGAADRPLTEKQRTRLCAELRRLRFRRVEQGDCELWRRSFAGFYGSFLTHLGILLIFLVGGGVLFFAQVMDLPILPDETLTLTDGTTISLHRFQMEDEAGRLDYASDLTVRLPNGEEKSGRVRVNEPMRVGSYKLYQQTYGTAGRLRAQDLQTGESQVVYPKEGDLVTNDGQNGLMYRTLYPGYVVGEGGGITLITSTSTGYSDPVYEINLLREGDFTPLLAFPGDELTAGTLRFTMLEPVNYPGLRVKQLSGFWMGLLYAVFALMVAALYLCFFMAPVVIKVTPEGFGVFSPKPQTGLNLAFETLLEDEKA